MSRVLMGVLALFLIGAGNPQKPVGAAYPIEAFAQLPRIAQPALSPDGKRFAAKIAIEGKQYLAVVTIDGSKPPRLINPGEIDLNRWHWLNDDWLVVGIGQLAPVAGDSWYVTRALGIHIASTKIIEVAGRDAGQQADDVIWSARDGSARVMIAYQTSIYSDDIGFWPRVEEVDLATGKRREVQSARTGVASWYADGDGVVRMGIGSSEDGRVRRVLYRDKANAPYRTVDRAKRGEDRLTVPALFLRDPGKALVIDDDDGGYSALYEFDLTTLERGKQIFASKGYDIGGLVRDSGGFGYLGVRVNENRSEIRWTDPAMADMQKTVSAQVKGAQATIFSLSRDRDTAILRIGGADTPGSWYLYRNADGGVMPLGDDSDAIGLKRLHPVRTIRYKARDGLEIAAVLTTPRRYKAGAGARLPLIVMPHGGPFARDDESWDWWTQFLADRGYAVVQPNYRGSSGYGTPFTKKGEGQWGLKMQDDVDDAVMALADLGIADAARVCVVGASYGGYAAMRAAQRDGKRYRCAISYAGVSDLDRMSKYQRNFLYAGARTDWLRAQAPDLKAVSPLNFPQDFSIPLLLMHGNKDRVVPPVHSKVMAQQLKRAGKDVTYIVQPQADHHFSRSEDRLGFLKAMEAFLTKHNPA